MFFHLKLFSTFFNCDHRTQSNDWWWAKKIPCCFFFIRFGVCVCDFSVFFFASFLLPKTTTTTNNNPNKTTTLSFHLWIQKRKNHSFWRGEGIWEPKSFAIFFTNKEKHFVFLVIHREKYQQPLPSSSSTTKTPPLLKYQQQH